MANANGTSSSKSIVIILIVLLGVGGIAFAVYWFYFRKQGKSCDSTSDCGSSDLVCVTGKCQKPTSCSTNSDCTASGTNCQNKLCKPITDTACAQVSDCPSGYFCYQGKCEQGYNQTCTQASDCQAIGYTCNTASGTCVSSSPLSCSTNADCLNGYICTGDPTHKCVAPTS